MTLFIDAKRAFLNQRGLGNYSRDAIRLLTTFAPDNQYYLLSPRLQGQAADFPKEYPWVSPALSKGQCALITPTGLWTAFPPLWRSCGCTRTIQHLISPNDPQPVYWGLSGEVPFGVRNTGCKVVVTMHDAIFMRYPELYSWGYRHLFERKVRYACHVADVIIAISEQTRIDLIRFFDADEDKIKVVYQGCNNRFREPVSSECLSRVRQQYDLPQHYILTVGAIEPRKNLRGLIEGMHSAGIKVPLVAVGGQSRYAVEMAELARERGVELQYLHNMPFADLPAVYKMADVFCYPSIFEGFGIPVLESMCIGTPIVTSTGSCFAETGGDAPLYAQPTRFDEIGEQLKRVLTDNTLRQEMVNKGYEQAEKFTDKNVANNLIKHVLL